MTEPREDDTVDTDRALADLLKSISRDVAHELRGPVQSVVVNLEVLRRRAAKGMLEDVVSRVAILEEEVRRLHALADAFIGLVREPDEEPVAVRADAALAAADPLIVVIAKANHVSLERRWPPSGRIVRVRTSTFALAVVRIVVALCEGAVAGATLVVAGEVSDDTLDLTFELRSGEGGEAVDAAATGEHIGRALAAADAWLRHAGGTGRLIAGSENGRIRVLVQVPCAT